MLKYFVNVINVCSAREEVLVRVQHRGDDHRDPLAADLRIPDEPLPRCRRCPRLAGRSQSHQVRLHIIGLVLTWVGLPANIGLGWKGLLGTNTLAYHKLWP